MTDQTIKDTRAWFEAHGMALDASPASQARILTNQLMNTFGELFKRRAPILASSMVEQTANASKAALHASLKQASGGLSLKTGGVSPELNELMKAKIQENVGLIRTIASDYLHRVQQEVMRSITQGNKDLIETLQELGAKTERKAELIALDQTRKTFSAINRIRSQELGVTKYEWVHSGGSAHPRELHMDMSGNIYSYDDPPIIDEKTGETGNPGDAINCRCTARPVIELELEDAP